MEYFIENPCLTHNYNPDEYAGELMKNTYCGGDISYSTATDFRQEKE